MTLEEIFTVLASGQVLTETEVEVVVRSQLARYGVSAHDGRFDASAYKLLDALRIQSQLSESTRAWLRNFAVVACIESTNTKLLEQAQVGDIDGYALVAEVQTGGRGRRGRRWVSPFAQNIALSVGVSIDRPIAEIGAVSLVIGLATASTLEAFGLSEVRLKWPNDVLLDQRKIGGILVELADTGRPAKLVVGIGVNVLSAPGVDVTGEYRATRILDHLAACSRNDLVAHLIDSVHATVREYERLGFEAFRHRWQQRDGLAGQEVILHGVEPPVRGIGIGIDHDGAYQIQTGTKIERAMGGNLSLRAYKI